MAESGSGRGMIDLRVVLYVLYDMLDNCLQSDLLEYIYIYRLTCRRRRLALHISSCLARYIS